LLMQQHHPLPAAQNFDLPNPDLPKFDLPNLGLSNHEPLASNGLDRYPLDQPSIEPARRTLPYQNLPRQDLSHQALPQRDSPHQALPHQALPQRDSPQPDLHQQDLPDHQLYRQAPDAGPMPHDEQFYDDAPRGKRRKGLLTVTAVLGLAVVGTVGAFGYRSLAGKANSSPPPVIRASGEPNKIAPQASNTDQTLNKFSYDRFGDRGKDEQVVMREERPVDSRELGRSSATRAEFPPPPTLNSALARPSNAAAPGPAMANPPSAIGEPRRVRTVPIRPEQQDLAANSPVAGEAMSVAPPRQLNSPALSPANRTDDVMQPPSSARAAPARAASQAPPRPASPRPAPPPANAMAANAPMSISPNGNDVASPPRAARVASAPTSAPASAGGSYVQVSAQRSEAEAGTAYRALQAKYPSILGSRSHLVRRADLGDKGIYYRALVGPLGSREAATELCVSLKSAGGSCIVQSN